MGGHATIRPMAIAALAATRSRSGLHTTVALCARDVGESSFEPLRHLLESPLCRLTIAADFFAGTFAKFLIDLAEDM